VEHQSGKGRTLLIGTFPGGGYYLHHSASEKAFFAGLLQWAKVEPALRNNAPGTQARLHTGSGGTYLYLVNPGRQARELQVNMSAAYGPFSAADDVWGGAKVTVQGRSVTADVGDRDAAVVRLK
jgi:beta-galactosidase